MLFIQCYPVQVTRTTHHSKRKSPNLRWDGWHFHYSIRHFESSPRAWPPQMNPDDKSGNELNSKNSQFLMYHMKCKSFYRYDKKIIRNKKNYPPIYQKSLKIINRPTHRPIGNHLKWTKPNYFVGAA